MNNKRREKLRRAIEYIGKASDIIEQVIDEEQDSMDNVPENLQMSDRYESMEIIIDSLEDVVTCIDEAKDKVESVMM